MNRLLCFFIIAFTFEVSAQSFAVKNVNDDYFVTSFYNTDISKNELHKFKKDKNGLYWFQYLTEIYSFDGVNWKSYELKAAVKNPFRINDIATTEDGSVWLATEYGIFVFDAASETFISIKENFPGIKNLPAAITCLLQGPPGSLIFLGFETEGFFLFDWKQGKVQQVIIDNQKKAYVNSKWVQITADEKGNVWGTTRDNRGIWHYDLQTRRMSCSWKGELPLFSDQRFQRFLNLTYSAKDNSFWITNGPGRYLEKINLSSGESNFYSFSENLKVQHDSNAVNRHLLAPVKIDMNDNLWVKVADKFLVNLNNDISKMRFLSNDWESLPIGDIRIFDVEISTNDGRNNISLWTIGYEKLSMIKKRESTFRHIYFDTLSFAGITPEDYMNGGEARQNIFFEKGRNDQYFLLQQNPGRPKLISLDKDLHITDALFNDEWKKYPAYFKQEFDPDTFFIALLRPDQEPLDFRNVVIKDFRVDLGTFHVTELRLNFKQRVWRYGSADKHNVYWLFSNGTLYSYDPTKDVLDSIFLCKPREKRSHPANLIKGYDFPTLLHKNSSTFWISFFQDRELYKINLDTKKIEKIFKTCLDHTDCFIPGAVYHMYSFDSTRIYFKSGLFGMLFNVKTNLVTTLSEEFQKEVPAEGPTGAGIYGDWLCLTLPSHIYLLNTVTSIQKVLLKGENFRWKLAHFHSKPLVNDHGEMILMSFDKYGFLIFNLDSAIVRRKPNIVNYSFIKVDDRNLPLDSLKNNDGLVLKYNGYNYLQLAFSDYSVSAPDQTIYEYAMYKGGDTTWNKINGKPELLLTDLSAGKYRLLLRASNVFGDYSEKVSGFNIVILPPYWQTWWFRGLILAGIVLIFYGLYRYRVHQLKRLQTIRNNIASDLHDDIGSTLNSISIYSEVAKQQAGKEIPALDLIGVNSRKIIESMSDIVWTINPENDSFEKIIIRMRSFAHQLLKAKKVEYTFEADEKLNKVVLPMQVRKNFYLVFKEAITNIIKYSEACRVSILLYEKDKVIMLRIRDNGKGIPVNAETKGNGLMNMSRRATAINAELNIISQEGGGTEIELMLDNIK